MAGIFLSSVAKTSRDNHGETFFVGEAFSKASLLSRRSASRKHRDVRTTFEFQLTYHPTIRLKCTGSFKKKKNQKKKKDRHFMFLWAGINRNLQYCDIRVNVNAYKFSRLYLHLHTFYTFLHFILFYFVSLFYFILLSLLKEQIM